MPANSLGEDTGDFHWVEFIFVGSNGMPTSSVYAMDYTIVNNTHATIFPSGGYLAAGEYLVKYHSDRQGYAQMTPSTVSIAFTAPTVPTTTTSFAGGKEVTITGNGFLTTNIENNDVRICGNKAMVKSATATELVIEIPPLVT